MAEEFQHAGLCAGGNYFWWNNNNINNNNDHAVVGSFGWPTNTTDMEEDTTMKQQNSRSRSSCDEPGDATTASDSSVVFQDVQKPDPAAAAHLLQIMGLGLSSSDWNQPNHLLHGGGGGGSERGEANYNSILQDMTSPISHQQVLKNQDLNCSTTSGFSDDNNYSCPTWLQTLFEPQQDHQPQHQQQQQAVFNGYCSMPSYATTTTTSMNQVSPSWQKLSPFRQPPVLEPKHQQQEQEQEQAGAATGLHFSNNTPYWNASSANTLFPVSSSPSQFVTPSFEDKPNCSNILITTKVNTEDSVATPAVKRGNSSDQLPAFKRPRIETPSPLPTFKVRKEKLGDRITALQQLVSPFGKTDTASVLHEAIEYIKFLHDQVSVLSTPYMKNGAPLQHQQVSSSDHGHHKLMKVKETDSGAGKQDLRSRGLCLVPISSTFPVANETTADFWTPTFGGTFR